MISSPEYLYFICVILITRLFFQFRDDPIILRHSVYKTIIESAALFMLAWNYWLAVVFMVIIILNGSSFLLESKSGRLKLFRLVLLFIYAVAFAFLFSSKTNIHFNHSLISLLLGFERNFVLLEFFRQLDWNYFLVVFTGFLLVLNEANIFIRYLMETLHLAPQLKISKKGEAIDTREYNRGRVIGILERILIYFFVLTNSYSAIGFILAAKGITRFKELENREFAEYFLIGTLLSSIISGAIALLIEGLI